MVGLTIEIVLDQDCWCLDFTMFDGLLRIFVGLWLAVGEHHLESGKGLSPLVSALLFYPNDSCLGAPCRCYAARVPLLGVLQKSLKSWLPQSANKKPVARVLQATHLQRSWRCGVWRCVWVPSMRQGASMLPQENVKALSQKVEHGRSFGQWRTSARVRRRHD